MKTTTEKLAITEHEYEMMVLAFTPLVRKRNNKNMRLSSSIPT
jgi:hypothetical protein